MDIRNLSFLDLVNYLQQRDEKPFRARQISDWIYQRGAEKFSAMSNLCASLRDRLSQDFTLELPKVLQENISKDKTIKFLFELQDKQIVESVYISNRTRGAVCVSTQAGCKFGCRFCASGIGGLTRNLTCAEILSQILYIKNHHAKENLTHVVFMGTGEPLDNYEETLKAIRTINSKEGMNIAARRITISTCGLIPQIQRLSTEGLQIELAISLHGSNDAVRDQLMPVNKKYPLEKLMAACREYVKTTNRQITFEYLMIKDVTVTSKTAQELSRLLRGIICQLNLIAYNRVAEFDYESLSQSQISLFQKELSLQGIHSTVRASRGPDVDAACGQLRHRFQS